MKITWKQWYGIIGDGDYLWYWTACNSAWLCVISMVIHLLDSRWCGHFEMVLFCAGAWCEAEIFVIYMGDLYNWNPFVELMWEAVWYYWIAINCEWLYDAIGIMWMDVDGVDGYGCHWIILWMTVWCHYLWIAMCYCCACRWLGDAYELCHWIVLFLHITIVTENHPVQHPELCWTM